MGDYWDATIATLQPLIAKPTLKPALLQKPPFRFLHDCVTAVMAATGFGVGLFDEDQLKSENVKEKEQKLLFLTRLAAAASIAIGREIDVNATKIIAGLEPEKTNALLQGMAEAARKVADGSLNMVQVVQDVNNGVAPGAAPAAAAAPAPSPVAAAAPPAAAAAPKRAPAPAAAAAAAPAAAAPASSPSGSLRATRAPITLPTGSGGEDFVATTTRLVGALISKPKMVDKLLRKPPFRFIHDIITAVMAATTYPEGYFTAEELDSGNFAETNAKLSFLQRLIDLVACTNAVDLSQVNVKKIAAGLEPENTNTLLQQFAYAAASGISAKDVATKLAGKPAGGAAVAAAVAAPANDEAEQARKAKAAADAEARKTAALAASEKERAAQAAAAAAAAASKPMPKLGLTSSLLKDDQSESSAAAAAAAPAGGEGEDGQVRTTKIERPKTARKAPPKLPSNLIQEKKAESAASSSANQQQEEKKSMTNDVGASAARVIAEGDNAADADDDDDDGGADENLMGGAGGDLAGFGDDGNGGGVDDGAVVRAMKSKLKEGAAAADPNAGGMKIRSAASQSGMSASQLDELRKQIQLLCQSVNPLGKCIDFVREDMDSMNKELQRWRTAHTEYTDQLEQERKATERIVEPLTQQLQDVELQIAEQQRKIHAIKAVILRNDSTIQQLLDAKTVITS